MRGFEAAIGRSQLGSPVAFRARFNGLLIRNSDLVSPHLRCFTRVSKGFLNGNHVAPYHSPARPMAFDWFKAAGLKVVSHGVPFQEHPLDHNVNGSHGAYSKLGMVSRRPNRFSHSSRHYR